MNRWLDFAAPHLILCITIGLVLFGLVMVYSTSAFYDYRNTTQKQWESAIAKAVRLAMDGVVETPAESYSGTTGIDSESSPNQTSNNLDQPTLADLRRQDSERRASMLSSFLKQGIWVGIGFLGLTLTAFIDYPTYRKRIGWLVVGILGIQLLLFYLPADCGWPIQAHATKGQKSWLNIMSMSIQPSEMVKLFVVIYTAWFLSKQNMNGKTSFFSMLPGLPVLVLSIGFVMLEPDKGVAAHICLSVLLMWMIGGGNIKQVMFLGSVAVVALILLVAFSKEAQERIHTFLYEPSFQIVQAYMALSRGGWTGVGLGNSEASLKYLYGAHTDFILAVIGEELGLLVVCVLVLSYLFLVIIGFKVAISCGDPFGCLLALGITLLIGSQAFTNMMMVAGLIPTTGYTLPLMSYGGSSITWTMAGIGILINVSRSTINQLLAPEVREKVQPFGRVGAMA